MEQWNDGFRAVAESEDFEMAHITEDQLRSFASRGMVSQSEADRVLGRRAIAFDAIGNPVDIDASRPSKYHNVRTRIDGITFDSKREASRYMELRLAEKAGRVRNLKRQVPFRFVINDIDCGAYVADFTYDEYLTEMWRPVVEDVKGVRTDVFKLKRKLMFACHGIEIKETR